MITPTPNHPDISIVAPCYNESAGVEHFYKRLKSVLDKIGNSYEIIFINDGSSDSTLEKLKTLRAENPDIRIIDLSRNFGKDIAMMAGIDHALGNAVIPIDTDLQDPPELIPDMLKLWKDGYDMIYATRKTRAGESWFKKKSAEIFYSYINSITGINMPPNTGDFRLMDRKVVESVKCLPERNRFMKGIFAWVGFKHTSVLFDREPRHTGDTKWNYWKLWNFALDGITALTTAPLRIWSYIGVLVSLLSFAFAGFLILRTALIGVDVPGYASLMVIVLFLGGIQLITLGILGEYLGRIFNEVKARPLYIVREEIGFDK